MMKKICAVAVLALVCQAGFSGTKDEMISDAVRKIAPTLQKISPDVKRVAVSTIEISSNSGIDIAGMQDQIGQVLLDSGRFQVIDRKSLKTLLDEQKLSLTGLVDPLSMAKAGKLIGVQGFFFGTVETYPDKLILNLKLVDADSGAISYAQKLTGLPQSFICLSFGAAFLPAVAVSMNGTINTAPAFGAQISYKQGFSGISFGYVGLDIVMTKTFSDLLEIKRADIKPKIYVSPKNWFNWDMDYVSAYLGVDFAMLLWSTATEPSAFGVYPVLGIEINPVRFLTVYAEASYVLQTALSKDKLNYLVPGLSFGFGATFNWYIF